MIGVDPLYAGSASFQAMFSVLLHFTGSPVSALTPLAVGPRHAGQLFANSTVDARQVHTTSDETHLHIEKTPRRDSTETTRSKENCTMKEIWV